MEKLLQALQNLKKDLKSYINFLGTAESKFILEANDNHTNKVQLEERIKQLEAEIKTQQAKALQELQKTAETSKTQLDEHYQKLQDGLLPNKNVVGNSAKILDNLTKQSSIIKTIANGNTPIAQELFLGEYAKHIDNITDHFTQLQQDIINLKQSLNTTATVETSTSSVESKSATIQNLHTKMGDIEQQIKKVKGSSNTPLNNFLNNLNQKLFKKDIRVVAAEKQTIAGLENDFLAAKRQLEITKIEDLQAKVHQLETDCTTQDKVITQAKSQCGQQVKDFLAQGKNTPQHVETIRKTYSRYTKNILSYFDDLKKTIHTEIAEIQTKDIPDGTHKLNSSFNLLEKIEMAKEAITSPRSEPDQIKTVFDDVIEGYGKHCELYHTSKSAPLKSAQQQKWIKLETVNGQSSSKPAISEVVMGEQNATSINQDLLDPDKLKSFNNLVTAETNLRNTQAKLRLQTQGTLWFLPGEGFDGKESIAYDISPDGQVSKVQIKPLELQGKNRHKADSSVEELIYKNKWRELTEDYHKVYAEREHALEKAKSASLSKASIDAATTNVSSVSYPEGTNSLQKSLYNAINELDQKIKLAHVQKLTKLFPNVSLSNPTPGASTLHDTSQQVTKLMKAKLACWNLIQLTAGTSFESCPVATIIDDLNKVTLGGVPDLNKDIQPAIKSIQNAHEQIRPDLYSKKDALVKIQIDRSLDNTIESGKKLVKGKFFGALTNLLKINTDTLAEKATNVVKGEFAKDQFRNVLIKEATYISQDLKTLPRGIEAKSPPIKSTKPTTISCLGAGALQDALEQSRFFTSASKLLPATLKTLVKYPVLVVGHLELVTIGVNYQKTGKFDSKRFVVATGAMGGTSIVASRSAGFRALVANPAMAVGLTAYSYCTNRQEYRDTLYSVLGETLTDYAVEPVADFFQPTTDFINQDIVGPMIENINDAIDPGLSQRLPMILSSKAGGQLTFDYLTPDELLLAKNDVEQARFEYEIDVAPYIELSEVPPMGPVVDRVFATNEIYEGLKAEEKLQNDYELGLSERNLLSRIEVLKQLKNKMGEQVKLIQKKEFDETFAWLPPIFTTSAAEERIKLYEMGTKYSRIVDGVRADLGMNGKNEVYIEGYKHIHQIVYTPASDKYSLPNIECFSSEGKYEKGLLNLMVENDPHKTLQNLAPNVVEIIPYGTAFNPAVLPVEVHLPSNRNMRISKADISISNKNPLLSLFVTSRKVTGLEEFVIDNLEQMGSTEKPESIISKIQKGETFVVEGKEMRTLIHSFPRPRTDLPCAVQSWNFSTKADNEINEFFAKPVSVEGFVTFATTTPYLKSNLYVRKIEDKGTTTMVIPGSQNTYLISQQGEQVSFAKMPTKDYINEMYSKNSLLSLKEYNQNTLLALGK